ncbi:hypothetical protein SDC9_185401 [bioreactor metagenome]|uniref:Uncharacterized protein n=1 Tax=bioreactor metagenome TaxID=1076179 RepID=A0A645HGL7_9ZZZZ
MFHIPLKDNNQHRGDQGQKQNAVAIAQPFALSGKITRHIGISGHDRQQRRQAIIGGIGRQIQNQHGGQLDIIIDPAPAKSLLRQLRQHGDMVGRQ